MNHDLYCINWLNIVTRMNNSRNDIHHFFHPKYFSFSTRIPPSIHIAIAMSCQSKSWKAEFFLKWYENFWYKKQNTCRCGRRLKSIILIYHDTIGNIWQDARVGLSIDSIIPPRDTKKTQLELILITVYVYFIFCFYMFMGNDESDLISMTM